MAGMASRPAPPPAGIAAHRKYYSGKLAVVMVVEEQGATIATSLASVGATVIILASPGTAAAWGLDPSLIVGLSHVVDVDFEDVRLCEQRKLSTWPAPFTLSTGHFHGVCD